MPASAPELGRRLAAGLKEYFHLAELESPVLAEGELDGLTRVHIDLSGARMDPSGTAPLPGGEARMEGRIRAHILEVTGRPIHLGDGAHLEFHLRGERVEFAVLCDAKRSWWLALKSALRGSVTVDVGEGQLESLFLAGLRHALTRHGITLQDGKLGLRPIDDRSVHLSIEVRARKGILKGGVAVEGRLAVDRQLNLCLSDVICSGLGLLGKMAVPFINPVLERIQAQSLPLLGHAFGEMDCHHLRIDLSGRDALKVEASFGAEGGNAPAFAPAV